MSEVIRDVVIRMRLEQQKADLQAPGGSGFDAQRKAAEEAKKATEESARATKEAAKAQAELNAVFNQTSIVVQNTATTINNYRQAAQSAASQTDKMAAGLKRAGAEWRNSGGGRDSWAEGLARRKAQIDEARKAAEDSQKRLDAWQRTNEARRSRTGFGGSQGQMIDESGKLKWANDISQAMDKTAQVTGKSMTQVLSHMTEGLEGVTRFSRGVALMAVSSEEDLHKLLVSLMKLQAGFDVVAGGAKFVKGASLAFGGAGAAVAGVTLVVGAGAVAWNAYKQSVEKARAELVKLSEDSKRASRAESELQNNRERAASSGQASSTDVIRDPDARRRRQNEELEARRNRVVERDEVDASTRRAIASEEQKARDAEANAIRAARGRSMDDVAFGNKGYLESPEYYRNEAARAKRAANGLRSQRSGGLQGNLDDLTRTKDIYEQQRGAQLGEIERIRSEAMGGALTTNAYQQKFLQYGDPRTQQRRQEQVDLSNQAYAQTARMFGAPLFTDKEVNESTSAKSKEINRAFDKLGDEITAAINALNLKIVNLKGELDAGSETRE